MELFFYKNLSVPTNKDVWKYGTLLDQCIEFYITIMPPRTFTLIVKQSVCIKIWSNHSTVYPSLLMSKISVVIMKLIYKIERP